MRATDDDVTLQDNNFFNYVNYPPPCLADPIEVGSHVAIQRFVRALLLPSSERCLVTVTNLVAAVALGVVLLAVLLTFFFGCRASEPRLDSVAFAAARLADKHPHTSAPVRIAILQDKTGSSLQTRTPLLTTDQLRRAAELSFGRGGEITVGLIRDESNNLFVRYTNAPPPLAPVQTLAHEANPIERQAATRAAKTKYNRDLADWGKSYTTWESAATKRETAFLAESGRLLATAPDAHRTDINGGLGRADLFLREEPAFFDATTHKYVILISDGIDNIHKPKANFLSGATVIVVNGAGSLGDLADLHPLRFESIDAALNFIYAKEAAVSRSR